MSGGKWPWWRWALLALNTIALLLSAALSWHFLAGGALAGCDGSGGCGQVLGSKWSVIAGKLPVSGLAIGVYLAIFFSGLYSGPDTDAPIRRLAWTVLLFLAGSITGMAAWFTIVQKWIIGEFCPYCMATHIAGVLLSAILFWQASRQNLFGSLRIAGLAAGGWALAGLFAVSQLAFSPSAGASAVELQEDNQVFSYNEIPVIGSPQAPYIVRVLFDYGCPHCQKIHFMLDEAVRRYQGKLAFALCPAPLNTGCNPYIPGDNDAFKYSCELAKIGLAVWKADRKDFPAFENWMFSFETGEKWQVRSPEAARSKAIGLVGKTGFEAALSSGWPDRYLQSCISIYGETIRSGKGGVPKLIFGSRQIIPEPDDTGDLLTILQKDLGVPAP